MRKPITGFTLIELLIVIGILAVLVVTILITLNPAEAQKKARDTKRVKDLAALESIIVQYLNYGNPPIPTDSCSTTTTINGRTVCTSDSAGKVKNQPCASNWTGVNLCSYTNTVPTDPANSEVRTFVSGTVSSPVLDTSSFKYYLRVSGSNYKICILQESVLNISRVVNDGGTVDWCAEAGEMSLF